MAANATAASLLVLDAASQASLTSLYASGRTFLYATLPYYGVMLSLSLTSLYQKRRLPRGALAALLCLVANTLCSAAAHADTAVMFFGTNPPLDAASCDLNNHFLALWFVFAQFWAYNIMLLRAKAVEVLGASHHRENLYRLAYVLTAGIVALLPVVFVFWSGEVVTVVDYEAGPVSGASSNVATVAGANFTVLGSVCVMGGKSWLNWIDLSLDVTVSLVYMLMFALPVIDIANQTRSVDVMGASAKRMKKLAYTNLALSSAAICVTVADMAWMAWANDAAAFTAAPPGQATHAPNLYLEAVAQIIGTTNLVVNNAIFHCMLHAWLPRPLDRWYRRARSRLCGAIGTIGATTPGASAGAAAPGWVGAAGSKTSAEPRPGNASRVSARWSAAQSRGAAPTTASARVSYLDSGATALRGGAGGGSITDVMLNADALRDLDDGAGAAPAQRDGRVVTPTKSTTASSKASAETPQ